MNTSHYPSLELCKKLTANGFHKTFLKMHGSEKCGFEPVTQGTFLSSLGGGGLGVVCDYVCPSVMELLDEIPEWIEINPNKKISLRIEPQSEKGLWFITYVWLWDESTEFMSTGTLPNALAEMWLWLSENNYLIK